MSPSSRRAWIEISMSFVSVWSLTVALLAEGVDRNFYLYKSEKKGGDVALLAEGVDRNQSTVMRCCRPTRVALLAEGVDRNTSCLPSPQKGEASPSSRRAWIEINVRIISADYDGRSPSSRRAWIEISC